MSTYTLSLGGSGISVGRKDASGKVSWADSSQTPAQVTYNTESPVSYGSKEMTLSLYGLSFVRKIYAPGFIQAELLIKVPSGVSLTVDHLTVMLVGRPVSLLVVHGETKATVAANYFIYEISPQYENGSAEKSFYSIYVKLDIYSKDKLLTLNKFSKAYLGKKLIGDIVSGFVGETAVNVALRPLTDSSLQNLCYKDSDKDVEYVHPYLVQYNESFYDFIKRVANRCGEAFYFEGGQLCFGLSSKSVEIKDESRIIFRQVSGKPLSVRDYARDPLKDRKYDDTNKVFTYRPDSNAIMKDPVPMDEDSEYHCPKDAFPPDILDDTDDYTEVYNSEIASEDQYMVLYKNKFERDDLGDVWWGDTGEHVMSMLSDILNSTSILELLTKFGTRLTSGLIRAGEKSDEVNAKGNRIIADASKPDGVDKYAVLFTGGTDDGNQMWLLSKYQDIRRKEEDTARKTICVDMGENISTVGLGDKIKISNSTLDYVVIGIEMVSGTPWQRTYESYNGVAYPDQTYTTNEQGVFTLTSGKQSQRIYAVPLEGGVFYPPHLPENPFRTSGPQPAFIMDAGDPMGQGRVRIRFAWQPKYKVHACEKDLSEKTKTLNNYGSFDKDGNFVRNAGLNDTQEAECSEAKVAYDAAVTALENARKDLKNDATPWIRMATPMASRDGAGMYFTPKVGDEVMVDFENGNVEHPYVVGALFSKNAPAPSNGDMVIVSRNGHTIKMSDPTDLSDFNSGVYPGIKYLNSLGVKTDLMDLKGDAKKILGGIELSDKYGFYSIKMSSNDRRIDISSPFGLVRINALTGISIDAPNGDISIKGKNVSISAYNKVSIESGRNVRIAKDGPAWIKTAADPNEQGKSLSKALLDTPGKFFDLTLIRSLLEIVIRPIDGTLLLKSHRFMQLEAGKGKTAAASTDYRTKFSDRLEMVSQAVLLKDFMEWLKDTLDKYVDEYVKLFNTVRAKIGTFDDADFGSNNPSAYVTSPGTREELVKQLFSKDVFTPGEYQTKFDEYCNTLAFRGNVSASEKMRFTAKIGALMKAVNDLHKCVDEYENLYEAPVSRVGKLSHVKSFLDVYDASAFKDDARDILTMDNPHVPNPQKSNSSSIDANSIPDPAPKVAANLSTSSGLYGTSLKTVKDFAQSGQLALFSNALEATFYSGWKIMVLRRLMCLAIEKARKSPGSFTDFKIAPAVYNPAMNFITKKQIATFPDNLQMPFSDNDWAKYVNEIKFVDQAAEPGGTKKYSSGLATDTVAKLDLRPESTVWKTEAKGEILFSDHDNMTYQFKNGSVEVHTSQRRELTADEGALKRLMLNLG